MKLYLPSLLVISYFPSIHSFNKCILIFPSIFIRHDTQVNSIKESFNILQLISNVRSYHANKVTNDCCFTVKSFFRQMLECHMEVGIILPKAKGEASTDEVASE